MTVSPAPPAQQPPPSSSSSGCLKFGLAGCAVIIAIGVIGIVVLAGFILGIFKSADVYKIARDRVTHDPRVNETLGAPVEAGWWVIGSVNIKHRGGNADITFPIYGSKGRAKVNAVAVREDGQWHYTELRVVPPAGPPIELVQ